MFPCASTGYTGTLIPLIIERAAFEGGDATFDGPSGNFDLGGEETGKRRGALVAGAFAIFG